MRIRCGRLKAHGVQRCDHVAGATVNLGGSDCHRDGKDRGKNDASLTACAC
jgi:hypothetical protein